MPTPPRASASCGGYFDVDAKEVRLGEINRALEDPKVWDDPKRAQELGKEKKGLDAIVLKMRGLDANARDSRELYEMAAADDDEATLVSIEKDARELPDWRIGCIFTSSRHRERGVAQAAVTAALEHIRQAGGGVVEAYPEQVADRKPQRGAYFHTGPETLYEGLGFVRDRRIAKWRWVMRLELPPA